jgi:hypothetical protein
MSRTIASALVRPAAGKRLISGVESTFARLAAANPQFAGTTML